MLTPRRLVIAGLALLVAALALWIYPSNDYIFLPDRAHPVGPLVTVAGKHEPMDAGGIYYVDVIVRKASILEKLFGGLHDGADLLSPSAVAPVMGRGTECERRAEHRGQRGGEAGQLQRRVHGSTS